MSTTSSEPDNAKVMSEGVLQLYEPHLKKVKRQLSELIAKQNKIYIELQTEKFVFTENNVEHQQNMMDRVKIYKEKLMAIKKQMTNIHQRTKSIKKRAYHIQSYKEKEVATRLQKQLRDEALIGKPANG